MNPSAVNMVNEVAKLCLTLVSPLAEIASGQPSAMSQSDINPELQDQPRTILIITSKDLKGLLNWAKYPGTRIEISDLSLNEYYLSILSFAT